IGRQMNSCPFRTMAMRMALGPGFMGSELAVSNGPQRRPLASGRLPPKAAGARPALAKRPKSTKNPYLEVRRDLSHYSAFIAFEYQGGVGAAEPEGVGQDMADLRLPSRTRDKIQAGAVRVNLREVDGGGDY